MRIKFFSLVCVLALSLCAGTTAFSAPPCGGKNLRLFLSDGASASIPFTLNQKKENIVSSNASLEFVSSTGILVISTHPRVCEERAIFVSPAPSAKAADKKVEAGKISAYFFRIIPDKNACDLPLLSFSRSMVQGSEKGTFHLSGDKDTFLENVGDYDTKVFYNQKTGVYTLEFSDPGHVVTQDAH